MRGQGLEEGGHILVARSRRLSPKAEVNLELVNVPSVGVFELGSELKQEAMEVLQAC